MRFISDHATKIYQNYLVLLEFLSLLCSGKNLKTLITWKWSLNCFYKIIILWNCEITLENIFCLRRLEFLFSFLGLVMLVRNPFISPWQRMLIFWKKKNNNNKSSRFVLWTYMRIIKTTTSPYHFDN